MQNGFVQSLSSSRDKLFGTEGVLNNMDIGYITRLSLNKIKEDTFLWSNVVKVTQRLSL
jgi:hypothetical protein